MDEFQTPKPQTQEVHADLRAKLKSGLFSKPTRTQVSIPRQLFKRLSLAMDAINNLADGEEEQIDVEAAIAIAIEQLCLTMGV